MHDAETDISTESRTQNHTKWGILQRCGRIKNTTRGFLPVHEFGFCLCPTNPKESLGCKVVKPWPPQGLVPTLRCPRCEAPVPLFIHKGYTRTSETSTKLSYCCRGMCKAQIPPKITKLDDCCYTKKRGGEATLIWMDRRCCAIPHQRSGAGI